jgi:hypothetical protein
MLNPSLLVSLAALLDRTTYCCYALQTFYLSLNYPAA